MSCTKCANYSELKHARAFENKGSKHTIYGYCFKQKTGMNTAGYPVYIPKGRCADIIETTMNEPPIPTNNTAKRVVAGGGHEGTTAWYECDRCGAVVDPEDNYCRNCGRKLEGGE